MHKLSDEEFDQFLTGNGSLEERARLEAHVASCATCWEKYQREYAAINVLGKAVEEAREKLSIDGQALRSRFADVMASARESGTVEAQIDSSLNILEAVLEPVLGRNTVQRAMFLAARSPATNPIGRISRDNWDGFLERLANIASILCGDAFAKLIREQRQIASAAL